MEMYGHNDPKYTPPQTIMQYMTGSNQNPMSAAGYNEMITYQQQAMMQQQMHQRGNANVNNNNVAMQDVYARNQM